MPAEMAMLSNTISDIQLTLTNSYKKLKTAIINDDVDSVASICTKQPRILTAPLDRKGNSPLGLAVIRGAMSSAKAILKCGADVDAGNITNGLSPLSMIVCQSIENDTIENKKMFVDLLVENNCQIDQTRVFSHTNRNGIPFYSEVTPLMDAISMDQLPIVEHLLIKGANVNFVCQFSSVSPLLYAAVAGNTAVIDLLIKNGADTRQKSSDGNCALHWLASCDKEEVDFKELVSRLVEAGCNINEINEEGQSPLMVAITKSRCRMVDELVASNANISIKDINGTTAQDYAYYVNCPHCARATRSRLSVSNI